MKRKQLLTFIFLATLFSSTLIFAQTTSPYCDFDEMNEKKMQQDENYKEAIIRANEIIYQKIKSSPNGNPEGAFREVLTIPVVIHVMHLPGDDVGEGSNISDAQIQAGLDHLNDAYRNINDYAGGPFYTDAGIQSADVEIEFCLAVRDPDGNPTTGINRIATDYSDLDRDEACDPPSGSDTQDKCLKALSFWDSHDYMNVWLVNEICTGTQAAGNYSCGVAGYAYLAGAHGSSYDGVVNEARYWGTSANNSKVHIHEVGHYLNLYHTFQDACNETDCLTGGDFVCDTPPDAGTAAVSCASNETANTCSNDASITNSPFTTDVQDIYEDYMDYGYQSCQNTFTPDQVTRMRTTLTTTRQSLLDSPGCTPATPPVSDFTSDKTSGCENVTITFEDISANGTNAWSWSFPGGSPSTSTDKDPVVTYPNIGTYDVTLTASNNSGTGSTETKTDYITINDQPASVCLINSTNDNTDDNYDTGITNVTLRTINNSTGSTFEEGTIYVDYSCSQIVNLSPNTTYTITVHIGTTNKENIKAFIDYDNSGDFGAGEQLFQADAVSNSTEQTFTTSSTPTQDTPLRLRVVSDFEGVAVAACTTPTYGQVEDYAVYFAAPLPVELTFFKGIQKEKAVQLSWQTASEKDNDFFLIEHSTDGIHFDYLTKTKGNENTTEINKYSYLHTSPATGINYYRLSQIDFDGNKTIAKIISVNFRTNDVLVRIAPNPIKKGTLSINYESGTPLEIAAFIVDITGKIVFKQDFRLIKGNNQFHVPVNQLAPGIYSLKTLLPEGIISTRFVKIK